MNLDLQSFAPHLCQSAGGWWEPDEVSQVSYPEGGHGCCFDVEDSSFWFQHRNRCILSLLDRFAAPGPLFDIGGGNGCVARAIQETGREVVLVEPGLAGVRNALRRGVRHVIRASLDDAGFLDETLPAVGLFDVIEHVADPVRFLTEVRRVVSPGGKLYLTVPALRWLWSHEDLQAGHFRRYTLDALASQLGVAGFQMDFASCFFGFLILPVLISRVIPFRLRLASAQMTCATVRSDHVPSNRFVSHAIGNLTSRELAGISALKQFRWGTSCLAVARKC